MVNINLIQNCNLIKKMYFNVAYKSTKIPFIFLKEMDGL
jgi:hypothetical protein